ncbi:MAG: hypothetical protein CMK59_02085 [Proteobacteria bacterium]|nr:hypothetical protein [Pseudomonadota bacterium]
MEFPPSQIFSLSSFKRLKARSSEKGSSAHDRLLIWTIERLQRQLPKVTDRIKRQELCALDSISSLWRCVDLDQGTELLIRYPHPEWSQEPSVLQYLQQSAAVEDHLGVLVVPKWRSLGTTGFLVYDIGQSVLFEDYVSSFTFGEAEWTILLFRLLSALNLYHHQASSPLSPLVQHVYFFDDGPRLIWFVPFPTVFHAQQDLQQLGRWLMQNIKHRFSETTLPGLVCDWSEHPPPSAATALALAQGCFYQSLYAQFHKLRSRYIQNSYKSRLFNILDLAKRLNQAPMPIFTLNISGETIRGTGDSIFWLEGGVEVVCGSAASSLRQIRSRLMKEENLSSEGLLLRRWLEQRLALQRRLAFLKMLQQDRGHR